MPVRAHLSRSVPPPPYWHLFGSWLGLTESQSGRLWSLVSASHDSTVRAWRLTCVYFHGPDDRSSCRAFVHGPLRPTRVIPVLEQLVAERRLSRQEANQMQEAILAQTTVDGYWT